ncbi:DUF3526 domain-containing protein [uncultured Pedobacter sp.]|uniref:DUF3526 domain-containing protein n=1 Tax=uncultured Pedobacter sp. TaxID=246139 RepID=UPI0025FAB901|nr:DUF3526 domain-containing protein [uncultured Pedobacter sp.]
MIKTLFIFEWKLWYRKPFYLVLLGFYIIISLYSIHYGKNVVASQQVVIDSLQKTYAAKIDESVKKFKSDTLTPQGKKDYAGVSEPSSVNYNIKPYAIFTPNGFSALAIGQRDVLPFYKQVSTERNLTQNYAPDISNPEILAEGNIDLSFVIIYLLPLLMIGFSYNVVSSENENGTFSLMAVQSGKPEKIVLLKYLIRISLILLITLALNIYGIIQASEGSINPLRSLNWIAIVCCYIFFWTALLYLFIRLRKSSILTVLYMSASWMVLALLIPFTLNLYIDLAYPTLLRADMDSEQRKIEEDVWAISPKDLIWNFYKHHPEYKTGNVNDSLQYSPRRFAAYYDEMERRLYPITQKFNDRIDERNALMTTLSDWVPTLAAQKAFNQLAQNDLASFKNFDRSTKFFQRQWQDYIYGFIFNDKKFSADDYTRFPSYDYKDAGLTIRSCLTLIFCGFFLLIATNNINHKTIKK